MTQEELDLLGALMYLRTRYEIDSTRPIDRKITDAIDTVIKVRSTGANGKYAVIRNFRQRYLGENFSL